MICSLTARFSDGQGFNYGVNQSKTICFSPLFLSRGLCSGTRYWESKGLGKHSSKNNSHIFNVSNFSVVFKKRITHGRVEIWSFSSSVQLDISRASSVNEWDIELDNSCLGTDKDSLNSEKYSLFRWHQINSLAKLIKFMRTPELLWRFKGLIYPRSVRFEQYLFLQPMFFKGCCYQSGFLPLCLPLTVGKRCLWNMTIFEDIRW